MERNYVSRVWCWMTRFISVTRTTLPSASSRPQQWIYFYNYLNLKADNKFEINFIFFSSIFGH